MTDAACCGDRVAAFIELLGEHHQSITFALQSGGIKPFAGISLANISALAVSTESETIQFFPQLFALIRRLGTAQTKSKAGGYPGGKQGALRRGVIEGVKVG